MSVEAHDSLQGVDTDQGNTFSLYKTFRDYCGLNAITPEDAERIVAATKVNPIVLDRFHNAAEAAKVNNPVMAAEWALKADLVQHGVSHSGRMKEIVDACKAINQDRIKSGEGDQITSLADLF